MCFSIVGCHFTAGCTIKEYPDEPNNGPANQWINNHSDYGSDLQDMILKSRVGDNISKWPQEQVTQLIHKCCKKTSCVRANQHQNHSNSNQRFQAAKQQPDELRNFVERLPILKVDILNNVFFMHMVTSLVDNNSFTTINLVSIESHGTPPLGVSLH